MSEYENEYDDDYVICPYCGDKYQPEGEDYSDESRVEKCDECGNNYHLSQAFSVTHDTVPDCDINDMTHEWEPTKLNNGTMHDFCSVCGQCRR